MTGFPVKDGFRGLFSTSALALLVWGSVAQAQSEPPHSAALDAAIISQARRHGVPEKLVRRIVMRESKYNPHAHNRAFWGLMQISYPTAKSMGFKGKPRELLDPFVNLTYAVPYLANAFIIAGKQEDAAVRLYASGYYQTAKSKGVLDELRTANSEPVNPEPTLLAAAAQPIANLATAVYNTPGAIQAAAEGQNAQTQAAQTQAAQFQTAQAQDTQAQAQLAQAQPQPAPQLPAGEGRAGAGIRGGGTGHEPEIMMVALKGSLAPPKKWTRDGGLSVIAKGDQRVEKFAAYRLEGAPLSGPKTGGKKSTHGKPKLTLFASLDPAQPGQPPSLAAQVLSNFQAYAPATPETGPSQGAIVAVATGPDAQAPQLRGPVDAVATAAAPPVDGTSPQAGASEPKAAGPKPADIKAADVKLAAAKAAAARPGAGKTVVAKAAPAKDGQPAKPSEVALAEPAVAAASGPGPAPASNAAPVEAATIPVIVAPPPPQNAPVKLTALVLRGPETAPVSGNALVTRGLLMGAAAPLSASAFEPLKPAPAREPPQDVKTPAPKPAIRTAAAHLAPPKPAANRPLAKTAAKPVPLHAAGG